MTDSQNTFAVVIGIAFAALVFIAASIVIYKTKESNDIEIVKARFAQVMFVGIITTFLFSAILYVFTPNGAGKEIFDKAVTAMTPLAGVIIGYLFSNRSEGRSGHPTDSSEEVPKDGNEGNPATPT